MKFIHIGRGSAGGGVMDAGAGYQPQLYAYCPNLNWNMVDEDQIIEAWYNHIIRGPLRHVWQEARLPKMELPPDHRQLQLSGKYEEKTLVSKDLLNLRKHDKSNGCVYDDLWKHI
jgi:hypothetical protein